MKSSSIHQSLPTHRSQLIGPFTLAVLAVISQVVGIEILAYDQLAIIEGEYWRLLTANLVHTNYAHLAMNLGGLFALWLLHGDEYKTQNYLGIALTCGLAITLAIYLLRENITWYVGLSGILHGIFVWGLVKDFEKRRASAWLLAAGLVLKLVIELQTGGSAWVEAMLGARIVVDAHLYGAIAGGFFAITAMALKRQRNNSLTS
ncbi:MAG: rhomboid family GlyGly-CTERM serine protease [Candidatus Azotimanducaceae bacterium]